MKKQTKLSIMLASIALLVVSAASLVSAKGWVQVGGNWYYQNADGDYVTETVQSSGNSKFYLGEDGAMVTNYFLESYGNGDNAYYFGSNGAMVTSTWVAIDPSLVSDQGDYVPDAYWYYFQATGKAARATGDAQIKKMTIDGKRYSFNTSGQMLTGWIRNDGSVVNPDDDEFPYQDAIYYAGNDNDGVLHSGWLAYYDSGDNAFAERDFLYFYFNPTNNKKLGNGVDNDDADAPHNSSVANEAIPYLTKKINGRTYAFSIPEGVMLVEWEGYHKATDGTLATNSNPWYFSTEDDGHRAQKGWVLTVPAYDIDKKDYLDDEENWFYFTNNGNVVENQIKKINGKYYAFNGSGEMKTGLIVFAKGEYQIKFDMDNTKGAELSKAGVYRNGDNEAVALKWDTYNNLEVDGEPANIHYFGSDGARRTGTNVIEFADDEYTFASNNTGNFEGTKSKKYYSCGIQLKASPDIRYGLMIASDAQVRTTDVKYEGTDFYVLNTSGARVKGANAAKKDADGNYWLIDKEDDLLIGVFTVQVRKTNEGAMEFKSDLRENTAGTWKTTSNKWIPFGVKDATGKTVAVDVSTNDKGLNAQYVVNLSKSMDYALNFVWDSVKTGYGK